MSLPLMCVWVVFSAFFRVFNTISLFCFPAIRYSISTNSSVIVLSGRHQWIPDNLYWRASYVSAHAMSSVLFVSLYFQWIFISINIFNYSKSFSEAMIMWSDFSYVFEALTNTWSLIVTTVSNIIIIVIIIIWVYFLYIQKHILNIELF